MGLVSRVVEARGDGDVEVEAVQRAAQELAAGFAERSGRAISIGKEAFYRQEVMDVEGAYQVATEAMIENMDTYDANEGIGAFLTKRTPTWRHK